jgi:peptide chain release factor 2
LPIFGAFFDAPAKQKLVAELESKIATRDFWQNQEQAQKVLQKRKWADEQVRADEQLARLDADVNALFELAHEGEDVAADLTQELEALSGLADEWETKTLLSGENDRLNAIVTIHPGAGGTESQDWAEMLLRMYLRWAERNGFRATITEILAGEEAGLKSVTFEVQGENAYGQLKGESGVHRLVRISPFDQAARRHTSFASVFVIPEIDDTIEVVIRSEDLRIDTFRSSGHGGQHVNVTDSAVRITHLPTGITAQCQNERSQHKNKDMAMKILRSRLYEHELAKRQEEARQLNEAKPEIAFGSQIRSYVLHPYRLIKDHRTKVEIGDVERVLDGDLDLLIRAYLLGTKKGFGEWELAGE